MSDINAIVLGGIVGSIVGFAVRWIVRKKPTDYSAETARDLTASLVERLAQETAAKPTKTCSCGHGDVCSDCPLPGAAKPAKGDWTDKTVTGRPCQCPDDCLCDGTDCDCGCGCVCGTGKLCKACQTKAVLRCQNKPVGYQQCTRMAGHNGPCAHAVPILAKPFCFRNVLVGQNFWYDGYEFEKLRNSGPPARNASRRLDMLEVTFDQDIVVTPKKPEDKPVLEGNSSKPLTPLIDTTTTGRHAAMRRWLGNLTQGREEWMWTSQMNMTASIRTPKMVVMFDYSNNLFATGIPFLSEIPVNCGPFSEETWTRLADAILEAHMLEKKA